MTLGDRLVEILEAEDRAIRDTPFAAACAGASAADLSGAAKALRGYQEGCTNLYRGVRALLFLAALDETDATALRAEAFRRLGDQVRASVRSSEGNAWLFEPQSAESDSIRVVEWLRATPGAVLREHTPVRLDLSHSGWSDIFFLGMDAPERARVINLSIDLALDGTPRPPIETSLRVIDRPVLRLVSEDLQVSAELTQLREVFAFDTDALGLLRAGLVASGLVPPSLEAGPDDLRDVLAARVGPDRGLAITTHVHEIPRGSRLGVSTMLLASLISVCMRATGQTRSLSGPLADDERRLVASRAVLGEWLGGSGGGWQDSGALWPGAKRIEGVVAQPGDPEFGASRGCLLPRHTPLPLSDALREEIEQGVVLAHGGLAMDVGAVLERVTEGYLLRDEPAWSARREAYRVYDEILTAWQVGDVRTLAHATDRNFHGPLKTILPEASNSFTERVIAALRERLGDAYRGFWMLGGMSGAGMAFWVDPARRKTVCPVVSEVLERSATELGSSLPFTGAPFVYDFSVNDVGTTAELSGP